LEAELQLDRLKSKLSRRVLLLQGHQSSWQETLVLDPGEPPVCHNLTGYLRDAGDFKDKLSPVALSLALALAKRSQGLLLYGDTLVQAQVGGTRLGTSLLSPGWAHPHGRAKTCLGTSSPSPPARLSPACPQCPQPLPGTQA
ncbi:ITA2B protein, partial [Hemiprocne comata]|nr:ITA2B protein [Hemiprocne comata]